MIRQEFDLRLSQAESAAKWALMPIGSAAWVLTFTPVAQLPSLGAVLSTGKQCLLLGICLLSWIAWERRTKLREAHRLADLSRPRPDSRPDKRDRRRLVKFQREQG